MKKILTMLITLTLVIMIFGVSCGGGTGNVAKDLFDSYISDWWLDNIEVVAYDSNDSPTVTEDSMVRFEVNFGLGFVVTQNFINDQAAYVVYGVSQGWFNGTDSDDQNEETAAVGIGAVLGASSPISSSSGSQYANLVVPVSIPKQGDTYSTGNVSFFFAVLFGPSGADGDDYIHVIEPTEAHLGNWGGGTATIDGVTVKVPISSLKALANTAPEGSGDNSSD